MIVQTSEWTPYGAYIRVVLVPSEYTLAGPGDRLIDRIMVYAPPYTVMLVSIEENGFRAYAPFQTQELLALLQLEELEYLPLDLSVPPPDPELPF